MSRFSSRVGVAAMAVLSTALALTAGEYAIRIVDHYSLMSFGLIYADSQRVGHTDDVRSSDIVTRVVASLAVPPAVKREWFSLSPPPIPPKPPHADLDALVAPYGSDEAQIKAFRRIWNEQYFKKSIVSGEGFAAFFKKFPGVVYVFATPDGGEYPRFRLFPDDPSPEGMSANQGMITNNLGYRGPDIPVTKPPNTIRIAFLGASTTIEAPSEKVSYTEYVIHWLNAWADDRRLNVRFDGVNSAREAFNSVDMAAVTRVELLPLRPDLVFYMEGGNQFSLRNLMTMQATTQIFQPVTMNFISGTPEPHATFGILVSFLNSHSAIFLRTKNLLAKFQGGMREVEKPPYTIRWPAGLDEMSPDIARSDLPTNLPAILSDLDDIRADLRTIGSELAVSSFIWLVNDGMKLDPVRHRAIYWHLNGYDFFWPYRYADIRRFADFQNRVWEKYCRLKACRFLDIAKSFPSDPDLFIDGVHQNTAGIKLLGWLTFLELLPLVEKKIAQKEWPKSFVEPRPEQPGVLPYRKATIQEIEKQLRLVPLQIPSLAKWNPSPGVDSTISLNSLQVVGDSSPYGQEIASDPIPVTQNTNYVLEPIVRVEAGEVAVGILDETGATWLRSPVDPGRLLFNSGSNQHVRIVVANNQKGQISAPTRFLLEQRAEPQAASTPNGDPAAIYDLSLNTAHPNFRLANEGAAVSSSDDALVLTSDISSGHYQIASPPVTVVPGRSYELRYMIKVLEGAMSIGIIDLARDAWVAQQPIIAGAGQRMTFDATSDRIQLVIANNNNSATRSRSEIRAVKISLRD